ncbi:hypothetical protein J6Z48_03285, partial [bacterium]|nr:hypothetical protein [bacterium]
MEKDNKRLYFFQVVLLISLLVALYISNTITRVSLAVFMVIYAIVSNVFIKRKRFKSMHHKQVILLMTAMACIYIAVFYLMGFYFGYYKAPFKFSIGTIGKYILPITAILVSAEYIRNIFIMQKSTIIIKSKKLNISEILLFLSMIVVDILVYRTLYGRFTNYDQYLTLLGLIIFSSVSCNLLYNYVSRRYGQSSIISYRLITTLYYFIFPLIPNVYMFFRAFLRMIIPYLIFLFLERTYANTRTIISYREKRRNIITTSTLFIVLLLFIMLISCKFRYGMLVIGSGSMSGSIDKGDAVVYEDNHGQSINEDDVVVFK